MNCRVGDRIRLEQNELGLAVLACPKPFLLAFFAPRVGSVVLKLIIKYAQS